MHQRLGSFAFRLRWALVGVLVALLAAGAVFGVGVADRLSGGGFTVGDSEADATAALIAERFGHDSGDVVALYSSPVGSVTSPSSRAEIARILAGLRAHPGVHRAVGPDDDPTLIGRSDTEALVVVELAAADDGGLQHYRDIEAIVRDTSLDTRVGGPVPSDAVAQEIARDDLVRAELLGVPLLFGLLLWMFRSAVAAMVPIVIGAASIMTAMLVLRGIAAVSEVSIFAMNIVTFLGIGLAVDYSLFVVHRFREELGRGETVVTALELATATAGRTVAFSGMTVAISLLGLLWFDIPILRGVAIGGTAVTLCTVAVALVLLPALLAVLGRRIDAARIGARPKAPPSIEATRWFRLAQWVMKRAPVVAIAVTAVLVVFALPARTLQLAPGGADMFPARTEARQVADAITDPTRFDTQQLQAIEVVVDVTTTVALADLTQEIEGLHGVERVDRAGVSGDLAYLRVGTTVPVESEAARDLVREVSALSSETQVVRVAGRDAAVAELYAELRHAAPRALATVMALAFASLLLAFRSLALPIKAFVMNVLSIGAGFGALVFVFQDGRLAALLGYEATPAIDPSILAVVFAITFGLSLDYEVFILSRVREEWLRTGDNRGAVARGLARTGRLVTGAALLLISVIVGFVAGEMVFIKQLGVGLGVAVLLDATLVRALLVPATMELLGSANWWAPRWLGGGHRMTR